MTDTHRAQFSTMSTKLIQGYFSADPEARETALEVLHAQYDRELSGLAQRKLRGRHPQIRRDVVQEAWVRCCVALDGARVELLKPRPERPSTGKLLAEHSGRAIETLAKREQRWYARKADVTEHSGQLAGSGVHERAPVTPISPIEFHAIMDTVWEKLLQQTCERERRRLEELGMVEFCAGDWDAAAERAREQADEAAVHLTQLVLERRCALRALLLATLKRKGLTRDQCKRFVRRLLPVETP